MGFKVVIIGTDEDGEPTRKTVHETDEGRRVVKVHVLTRTGETATIGVDPDQGDMALEFDYAPAGQLHVSDLDNIKLGYEPNLTGDEVARREEKLSEIRGDANGSEVFTQDAVDAARKAEEADTASAETEEERTAALSDTEEPASEGQGRGDLGPDNRGDSLGAEKGETLPDFSSVGEPSS